MTGNNYFAPINAGGLQSFTATGQTGWYQFNVPGAVVPVLPGVVVPDNATGMVVQAVTAIAYGFSPTAAQGGTTAWLTLPAGGSVVVSGKQWVRQFCVRLGLTPGASFTVQFLQGNIGPVLEINAPTTGGVIPPPPPGLSAVRTPNVLHVMPTPVGNDATGAPYRLDLPYATIAAAESNAAPGDTIMIWAGTYVGANLGATGVNYELLGATIEDNGTNSIFNGLDIGNITGNGLLNCINGAPLALSIAGTTDVLCTIPIVAGGDAVNFSSGGSLTLTGRIQASGRGIIAGGVVNINANLDCSGTAIECNSGIVRLNGHVVNSTDGIVCNGGSVSIYGNVNAANNGMVMDQAAVVVSQGSISAGNFGVSVFDATFNHEGKISGSSAGIYVNDSNAIVNVIGDIVSNGTAVLVVIGSCTTNGTLRGDIGSHMITGQHIHTGAIESITSGAICESGKQVINASITSSGIGAQTNDPAADQTITGQVISQGVCLRAIAGQQRFNGNAVSVTDFGATVDAGAIQRLGGYVKGFRSSCLVLDATATLILGPALTLISDDITCVGSGGGAMNVLVAPAVVSNKPKDGAITELVNTIQVNALYQ